MQQRSDPMTETNGRTEPLPIEPLRERFLDALERGNVVVTASTGTGKSTRLPIWAARRGSVLVVEPRRLAARSLAGFVAASLGEDVGGRVGYAVRQEACYAEGSEIVFVTPGIALRWHAEDRLGGFDTVVLDEFHERRWDTDLLLGLLRSEAAHRLVVTSATLQAERLAGQLDGEHLHAEGASFPVETEYLSRRARETPNRRHLAERVAEAVPRALVETDGDVLVFLPGRGEIESARGALRAIDAEIVPLHAAVALADQRRALNPGSGRRVILATNVAETSLTVPGVTAIVDSGLQRRTERRNGRTVLSLQAVAQSSADQRKGRAGRLRPGRCYRLWDRAAPLTAVTPPEIQREDLTELVLAAACAGRSAEELAFPDPPPEEALASARVTLQALGAVDGHGRATDRGRRLFSLPVDAVLAHLVVAMPDGATAAFMADLVAGLSAAGRWASLMRDPAERERLHEWLRRRCDATWLVAALRFDDLPGTRIDARGRDEARRLSDQLRDLLRLPRRTADLGDAPARSLRAAVDAFPRMSYVRREKRRQAMGNGAGEVIVGDDTLLADDAEAALVFDVHSVPGRGTRETVTIATCLAPIPTSALVEAGVCELTDEAPEWEGGRIVVQRRWRYAGRVVDSESVAAVGEAARHAAASLILENRLLKPAGTRLRDDLDAWALYVALGLGDGEVPAAAWWLTTRLEQLGVERSEDLALIEPEDLAFEGVPHWEREAFERKYPREVSLTDLHMRIHYDVRRREVIAEKVGGVRRRDPQRWELPAWSGWKVKFQRASRVVEIR